MNTMKMFKTPSDHEFIWTDKQSQTSVCGFAGCVSSSASLWYEDSGGMCCFHLDLSGPSAGVHFQPFV